jgi:hypothetical protein
VVHELLSHRDYVTADPVSYWRSTSGFELDFVLGDHSAVEVKAKPNVSSQDLKGLRALREEGALKRYVCVCLAPRPRRVEGIEVLPLRDFLARLWAGGSAVDPRRHRRGAPPRPAPMCVSQPPETAAQSRSVWILQSVGFRWW